MDNNFQHLTIMEKVGLTVHNPSVCVNISGSKPFMADFTKTAVRLGFMEPLPDDEDTPKTVRCSRETFAAIMDGMPGGLYVQAE